MNAAHDSGLERADWAKENGIDPRSLNAWRINLGRTGAHDGPRMVELVAGSQGHVSASATYTVRCGRFAVEIDADFDEQVVTRLLTVVASC